MVSSDTVQDVNRVQRGELFGVEPRRASRRAPRTPRTPRLIAAMAAV
jgi:hypothetical protein